jgi:protein-arginine kinase activator protein McsA
MTLCDNCHQKDATAFLTQIRDGKSTKRTLCEDCFREHSAATGGRFPILDGTQRCYYCGAQARSGGTNDEAEQCVRHQRWHFTCVRCGQLYLDSILPALAAIPDGVSQRDAMIAVIGRTDDLVREKLREERA